MTMKTIIAFTTTAAFCAFLVCASPLKAQNPTDACALPDNLKQLTLSLIGLERPFPSPCDGDAG